jgi:hypothetical protein
MPVLVFGITEETLPPRLVAKLRGADRETAIASVARKLLSAPDHLVLPQLIGPPDALTKVRARQWSLMQKAVSGPDLKKALISELRALVVTMARRMPPSSSGEEIALEGGSVDGCPWWMPSFLCDDDPPHPDGGEPPEGGTPPDDVTPPGDNWPGDGGSGGIPHFDLCPVCFEIGPGGTFEVPCDEPCSGGSEDDSENVS